MRLSRRKLASGIVWVLCVAAGGAASAQGRSYRTQNVVIAVMDGTAWRQTFGDPEHRFIPRLWNELRPRGVLYTSFYNNDVTITKAGHSTIATGTWQKSRNRGPRQTMPTLFDYLADEQGVRSEAVWVVFGKGRYAYDPSTSFPAYSNRFKPSLAIDIGESSLQHDVDVFDRVLGVMKNDRPRVVFANFGSTDHMAHSGSWERHVKAIEHQDRLLADLWKAIQDDTHYRDRTTLFLTNDHGYHLDGVREGFAEHGDACEGCRHIMLLVLGPDTKQGAAVARPAYLTDIAPTVGELLGFQTPLASGEVLKDAFLDYRGLNQKQARTKTAREAVRMEELARSNLVKHLADQVLAKGEASMLAKEASPSTALLLWGLLSAFDKTGDTRYREAVRSWAEHHLEAKGDQAAYAGLVFAELTYRLADHAERDRFLRAGHRIALDIAQAEHGNGQSDAAEMPAFQAMLMASASEAAQDRDLWQKARDSLLAHLRRIDSQLATANALGLAGTPAPLKSGEDVVRAEGKVVPTQRPLQEVPANPWMLLALSGVRSHGLPFKGEYFDDVPELGTESVVQGYLAAKALAESGEIWPDPLEAALNIAAIKELQRRKDPFKNLSSLTEFDIVRTRPDSPEGLPGLAEIKAHIGKIVATNYNVEYGFPPYRDFDYTIDRLRLRVDEARSDIEIGAFLMALDPFRRIPFEPHVATHQP